MGFSAYTNSIKLLDTSPPRKGTISCINGIRFISMTWILLSHCYSFVQTQASISNNKELGYEVIEISISMYVQCTKSSKRQHFFQLQIPFMFRVIENGFPSVDSFFIIGACLLSFLTLKEMDKTDGWLNARAWSNIPMMYIHRYIR